ncbi:MAG: hypothetical protein K6G64_08690 [Eubacterium sp.]|nr:hypothetical protein [Eubacterium sp.]
MTYTYEYDALGRVTKEEGKDEESEDTVILNRYTYDEYGKLVTVSSGSGENISTKHYAYNSRGEVTEETDGNSNTTS